jgi:hypothetical protein
MWTMTPRRGAAHGRDLDLPAPLPPPFNPSDRGRFDVTRIIHLTAGFDVEAGLGEDDFDLVAKGGGFDRFAIDDQRQDFAFDARAVVGSYSTPSVAEFALGLQVFEDICEEFRVLAAERAHGFAAAGGFGVFSLASLKPASSTSSPCSRAMSRLISKGSP